MNNNEEINKVLNDKAISNRESIQKVVDEHALRVGDKVTYITKLYKLDAELRKGTIRNIRKDHIVIAGKAVDYILARELEEGTVKILVNETAVRE